MPYSKSGNNERLTSTLRLHQTYSHFGVLRWKSGVAVDAFHVHLHRVTQRSPTERITKNQPGATTQRSEGTGEEDMAQKIVTGKLRWLCALST